MPELRILIVDDDEMVRTALSDLLRRSGHEVYELPSAIGVTRAIIRNRMDAVLIDIQMPTMPGDKLAQLLRGNPRLHALAVVLISSRPEGELEAIARKVDADAVVTKAEAPRRLVDVVEEAVRARQPGC